jgi:precorrin-6B C5,15-methyltransferase / cobalt-precorrin-6B C5,C15-methyltransferase
MSAITVVGIGADGWVGVPERLRAIITGADVLLGGSRHLALVPERPGQVREPWPSPLRDQLPKLLDQHAGRQVVVLASGDPLVSGIGSTLIELLGAEQVTIEPAVSSIALARARMGWPAESVEVVSLVGRDVALVRRALAPGRQVLVLSSDETTPKAVAELLTESGYAASTLTTLGNLGADDESRQSAPADEWAHDAPRLHVLAIECRGPVLGGWLGGLPDDAFEHDGQLTKRDLRASALARLAPQPGQLLWDVGAGAGSVGIEWLRAHPTCRAIAIEANPQRAQRIERNAARLGVPTLGIRQGRAPEALDDLEAPDAIFVGGGATADGLLERCRDHLKPGGRLVVHGVTLETETLLGLAFRDLGGELTRHSIEHAAPIGTFTGWTPARAVTQWAWTKPQ